MKERVKVFGILEEYDDYYLTCDYLIEILDFIYCAVCVCQVMTKEITFSKYGEPFISYRHENKHKVSK